MKFEIDNDTPPIVSFPDDDYPRVVWVYGAVLKNKKSTSSTPTVIVMLKNIDNGKIDIESITYVEVSVVELDIVRLQHVWLGNRKTTSVWKDFKRYKEKMKFEFNFKYSSVKSIAFNTKKPNSNYFFIPSFVYNLGKIESKQNLRYFLNAQFTHLTSTDNKTILIPALELFTSTYVPRDKIMRAKLLTSSYQNVIDYYIKSATIKDNKYHVEFNKNKQISNEVFLAYLALNKNTQNSLTILRSSLETDSSYYDRYPVVHPYSPENFEIE
ncbi:MAG: hypothetical protein PHI79_07510, partial [Sulfurovaceae bacterium]|nr:hypothetical protein [Sulfurovaceae bacterium]